MAGFASRFSRWLQRIQGILARPIIAPGPVRSFAFPITSARATGKFKCRCPSASWALRCCQRFFSTRYGSKVSHCIDGKLQEPTTVQPLWPAGVHIPSWMKAWWAGDVAITLVGHGVLFRHPCGCFFTGVGHPPFFLSGFSYCWRVLGMAVKRCLCGCTVLHKSLPKQSWIEAFLAWHGLCSICF